MTQIPIDCPHCVTKNVGSTALAEKEAVDSVWHVFCSCNNCGHCVIVRIGVVPGAPSPLDALKKAVWDQWRQRQHMFLVDILPKLPQSNPVAGLPPDVEESFDAARLDYGAGRYTQACFLFRQTLERAMYNLLEGSLEKKDLWQKIEKTREKELITKELARWAQHIRVIGNEAVHKFTPTAEDAADMETFTRLFLMYVYTLPAMLEARTQKKVAA